MLSTEMGTGVLLTQLLSFFHQAPRDSGAPRGTAVPEVQTLEQTGLMCAFGRFFCVARQILSVCPVGTAVALLNWNLDETRIELTEPFMQAEEECEHRSNTHTGVRGKVGCSCWA